MKTERVVNKLKIYWSWRSDERLKRNFALPVSASSLSPRQKDGATVYGTLERAAIREATGV